jgi:predicted CXXCH cytochrome family protein
VTSNKFLGILLISLFAYVENLSAIDMHNKTCIDYNCHADLQSKAILHGPVNKGNCNPCHIQIKADLHQFQLSQEVEKLCQVCHTLSTKNYVHQPVTDGRCVDCHDPHQSDYQFLLKADPSKDLCLTCHDPMEKQHMHDPVAMGACILCHEPHSSWEPKLLVTQEKELCITCHEENIRLDKQARHIHPPIEGDCVKCHNPHSSDFTVLLLDEPRKLCVTCHEEIEQLIVNSKIVHGAINQDRQCENCHYGHSSSLPNLLKKSPLDTCLTCHDREISLENGRKIENMAELLKKNPNHHGPIRQADCSACHNPHASAHFNLLKETYPESFNAPFDPNNYKLCFKCHRSELVSSEGGGGLTQFRDGEINLHYIHVKSSGLTCRACHAVHASKRHAHISESVSYGQWQYALNFELKKNGGSCGQACHKAREYDRTKVTPTENPVDKSMPEK